MEFLFGRKKRAKVIKRGQARKGGILRTDTQAFLGQDVVALLGKTQNFSFSSPNLADAWTYPLSVLI